MRDSHPEMFVASNSHGRRLATTGVIVLIDAGLQFLGSARRAAAKHAAYQTSMRAGAIASSPEVATSAEPN